MSNKPTLNHSKASLPLAETLAGRCLLLTGATGFLGKTFLYVLLRHHPEIARVYLLVRGDRRAAVTRYQREILESPVMEPLRRELGEQFEAYLAQRIALLPGDISQPGLLNADASAPEHLDVVVHCAGLVNFEASLEKALVANTLGVANVIEFCRHHGAAMLHVSTCYSAGEADGQRYEDDLPSNWSPRGPLDVAREIQDARAAIERIERASREQATVVAAELGQEGAGAGEGARKRWIEERLKAEGLARSLKWGWPNTYSYTKSLGEQLVLAARDELAVSVVRPAVIESALADPFPGWNQGVNTSAPLTYLSGEGFRFYPARPDLVLDVIPVDMVAHAMVPILAALLRRAQAPIYQLGTSDCNPLTMRRLVELTALGNREHQRDGNGTMGRLAPHLEAVVVSKRAYDLVSRTAPEMLKSALRMGHGAAGGQERRASQLEQKLDRVFEQIDIARAMVEVYRPYIQDLTYTFHGRNVRRLYARLDPAEAARHPYRPEAIDWLAYWTRVHLPGLRRHIFPQLELHTRGRKRAPRRHRHLLELLERAAERFSGAALEAHRAGRTQSTLNYRELRDRAARAGMLLASRGVGPGDRVLLISENSPDWVLGFFAILNAGAIAVPLDPQITPAELAAICRIAQPGAALLSDASRGRLAAPLGELSPPPAIVGLEELSRPFLLRGTPPEKVTPERKTPAAIFFTSGSTGAPKGVVLTHGNLCAEVSMLARVFVLSPEDTVLSLLPLHHTFEFTCGMLLPLNSGARVVYPLGVDAASLASTLAQVRPTAVIGVPALWQAIHRRIVEEVEGRGVFFQAAFEQMLAFNRRLAADFGLNLGAWLFRSAHQALGGRLRLLVSGGAALPVRVAEFYNDLGLRLLEGYGMTEAGPVLSVAYPDEPPRPGSVGKPLAGIEVRLAETTESGVGEIVARGPNVMAGYYRDPAATQAALRDGWLHTGDLGRFDEEGRLYIVGRAKDVIVDAGGNNIYIDEIEEAYGHSPYLKEIAVVGLKTPGGEQVAALVVPAYARGQSRRMVQEQLNAHFAKVAATLSAHKRIRILRFTDSELPRTRTRKIKRAEVEQLLDRMIAHGADSHSSQIDVEPWLVEAIAQVAGNGVRLNASTRLVEDLGLDSLALAELGEQVAQRTERELTPEELANLRSVEDLQKAIASGPSRPRLPSYAQLAEPYTPALPWPLRVLSERAADGVENALVSKWLQPRVMGRGNIPANRNLLVIANHCSHVDFAIVRWALGTMGERLVVLAARDYFFNTAARRFIAHNLTPLIPFDRERAQLESLDQALAQLAAGRSVLMFPEGTRSPDGSLQEFKSGAGYLALRSRCDVLPVHLEGTFDVLGKGRLLPRYHPVQVRIGAPIAYQELRALTTRADGAGAYRSAADFMHQAIVSLAQGRARPRRELPAPLALPAPPSRRRARLRQS